MAIESVKKSHGHNISDFIKLLEQAEIGEQNNLNQIYNSKAPITILDCATPPPMEINIDEPSTTYYTPPPSDNNAATMFGRTPNESTIYLNPIPSKNISKISNINPPQFDNSRISANGKENSNLKSNLKKKSLKLKDDSISKIEIKKEKVILGKRTVFTSSSSSSSSSSYSSSSSSESELEIVQKKKKSSVKKKITIPDSSNSDSASSIEIKNKLKALKKERISPLRKKSKVIKSSVKKKAKSESSESESSDEKSDDSSDDSSEKSSSGSTLAGY